MKKLQQIIIHHSASGFGDVEDIRRWHQTRGWRDCGYNIVILNGVRNYSDAYDPALDGRIEVGRGLDFNAYIDSKEHGAHALGYNSISIGICCIGMGRPTTRQFESLEYFCRLWLRIAPWIKILGHKDVTKTACPGFEVREWLDNIGIFI